MNVQRLTLNVKEYAQSLGFDLCGIAAAGPAESHERYAEWLARSYHGQMGYMARPDAVARRADVRELLPEAKSVIAVAMNYYAQPFGGSDCLQSCHSERRASAFARSEESRSNQAETLRFAQGDKGKVARYAWGPDYHDVITGKLKQLTAWIEAEVEHPVAHKICVDTSAILEREWAVRAGLGWIGKNTVLINPHIGSWLLLGELLVDLELEPDPPFKTDRCGTCTRCIEDCPTDCILPDRTLDARRCISYLTIELRDDIPVELRELMGDWVFGCDVCQEVCPWNRFAPPSNTLEAKPEWSLLDLAEITAMDETAFRAGFAGSAITRARRSGLARNAAVAAENMKRRSSK